MFESSFLSYNNLVQKKIRKIINLTISITHKLVGCGLLVGILGASAFAASPASFEDFRFPREASLTKDGYPTPLSGQPITKTPVIAKKKGITLKKYPALLDKVFINHLHLDHCGGIFPLFDAMGWGRNTPLRVWGPSGTTPELGTAAFTENVRKAAEWHVQSKRHVLPTGGTTITTTEIDSSKFSPENPRQLVYNENDVKIYAFPVVHCIEGSLGYRLEWKGLSFVYTADSEPSTFEAEQAKGADIFIHEVLPSPEDFAVHSKLPLELAKNVINEHTVPEELGLVFSIAKPGIGVGSHYILGDTNIDNAFKKLRTTYDGPVMLAHNLSVINVTPEQIVIRQAKTSMLAPVPDAPKLKGIDMNPGKPSDSKTPAWLSKTKIVK